jgi:hypothetical protein
VRGFQKKQRGDDSPLRQELVSFFLKFFVGYALIRAVSIALGILYLYYGLSEWDTALYLGIFTYVLFYAYGRFEQT